MRYKAEIFVKGDSDSLYNAFMVEKGKFSRSEFDIEKQDGSVRFFVKAEDSTALRATLNSITKLLTVYEKTKGV